MPIAWTKDALSELTPKRGEAKKPNLAYDPDKLRTSLVAALDAERPKLERAIKKKLGDVELAEEVLAHYKDFDSLLDPRLQGAIVTVLRAWGNHHPAVARDLLRHWIARGGPAFALRAQYEHSIRRMMHPKGKSMGFDFEIAFIEMEPLGGWSLWGLKPDEIRADLSRAILAADDASYAEVVAAVDELRLRSKEPGLRCDLSSLVPTERAWATADVKAALATKNQNLELRAVATMFPAFGRGEEAKKMLAALAKNPFVLGGHVYDAIRELEDDAIPALVSAMKAWESDAPRANMGLAEARHVARALALFDDERAADALAAWVGDPKTFGPIAAEYMQRFPARATLALAPRLLEKTKAAEPAQHLLSRIARAHAAKMTEAAQELSKDLRAAVEKLCGASTNQEISTAPIADVPEVLRDPPWRRKGTRPSLPIVDGLVAPKHEDRVVWESEAQRKGAAKPPWSGGYDRRLDLAKIRAQVDELVRAGEDDVAWVRRLSIPWHQIDDDGVVALWNEAPMWTRHALESSYFSEVACMLARFGPEAIPGAIASTTQTMVEVPFEALMRCDSPRVAPLALRGLGRGALRRAARGWFRAFPEAAVIGLLPIALGQPSRDKADAAAALRQHVDRERLLEIAAKFGAEAARAAEAMLAFDPMFDCPKSPPKLSAFADPGSLPPLNLRDGRVVPEDGKRNFLEMLQFTPLDPSYPGIAAAKAALDPRSVDEILRALLDAWVSAGAATANAWALRAVGHVGSDAMARDLAAKIRKWPREKGRPRALLGVDVLGKMGSDVALMHLFDLSKTAKNRHVEARAKEVLAGAAASRGLSGDALEDRLVPSLDLDKDGSTTLDFGARKFVVRVDEQLAPHVFDQGTRLPSLPRATKTDVAEKAKAASARFKTLKSDLETLAKTQLWRFENAMIRGRRWDAREHRALLVDHPLAGRIARKVLWAVVDRDRIQSTFRVAEDGTLADDRDAPVTLSDDARIGIPHPLAMDDALKTRWSGVFGDYGIIQPFEQLGRATFAATEAQAKKTSIDTFKSRAIPYGVVFGRLESRGWRRGPIEEGSISTLEKDFGAMSATLSFDPPIFVRDKPPDEVTIEDVWFGATLRDVPAIVFSEAMYDLSVFLPR